MPGWILYRELWGPEAPAVVWPATNSPTANIHQKEGAVMISPNSKFEPGPLRPVSQEQTDDGWVLTFTEDFPAGVPRGLGRLDQGRRAGRMGARRP